MRFSFDKEIILENNRVLSRPITESDVEHLLPIATDRLGAARVEFKTDERNIASRKAIEKIDGRYEGILRSHTLMSDGFRRNTVCYSILKPEWEILKVHFLDYPSSYIID